MARRGAMSQPSRQRFLNRFAANSLVGVSLPENHYLLNCQCDFPWSATSKSVHTVCHCPQLASARDLKHQAFASRQPHRPNLQHVHSTKQKELPTILAASPVHPPLHVKVLAAVVAVVLAPLPPLPPFSRQTCPKMNYPSRC